MAENNVKIRLQGHEKFALRDGWLNKGIIILQKDPKAFSKKDAPDVFGIGANMVKSLRYWMKAFGLIEDKGVAGSFLTPIGKMIAQYDLYLEDNFTLWLLQSNIVKNVEEATTWYMFFNRCKAIDFSKEQIISIISREITKYINNPKFAEKSLKNDVDVLLNMYSIARGHEDPEEKNVSPFSVLELVKKVNGLYTKNEDIYRTLSEWNVLYELYLLMKGRQSIAIEELSERDNSLTNIYQLSGVAVNEYLDRLENLGYIHVDRTAGLDMVYKVKDVEIEEIVEEYYQGNR